MPSRPERPAARSSAPDGCLKRDVVVSRGRSSKGPALLTQIHQHAAAAMPEIAKESHASFERLVALVQRETKASPEEIQRFVAHGTPMSVLAAIDAQDSDGLWAAMLRVCSTDPPAAGHRGPDSPGTNSSRNGGPRRLS